MYLYGYHYSPTTLLYSFQPHMFYFPSAHNTTPSSNHSVLHVLWMCVYVFSFTMVLGNYGSKPTDHEGEAQG